MFNALKFTSKLVGLNLPRLFKVILYIPSNKCKDETEISCFDDYFELRMNLSK
jgi:hypothetical protein